MPVIAAVALPAPIGTVEKEVKPSPDQTVTPGFAAPAAARKMAVTESDILGPSEAFRKPMDYYTHAPQTRDTLERLAQQAPATLACMHGSAWRGDGAALLRSLGAALG